MASGGVAATALLADTSASTPRSTSPGKRRAKPHVPHTKRRPPRKLGGAATRRTSEPAARSPLVQRGILAHPGRPCDVARKLAETCRTINYQRKNRVNSHVPRCRAGRALVVVGAPGRLRRR